ncbi:putative membrane protein [Arthrobacter sp. AZCC_0090]|nr:putative membrane protein [Arthrobacter sp. AZCC_0090]
MDSIMNMPLKQERRILFTVWAVAVVAGVVGGPFLATVTGQPVWVFLGLLVLAVLLGLWHSSFRRRSQRPR